MKASVWFVICAAVVRAAVKDEVETVEVTEGATVTLRTDWTGMKKDDVVQWEFGFTDTCIAVLINMNSVTHYDERFRDRLQLDTLTGSLTISNIRITHSGHYKVLISSEEISIKHFSVTVYTPLSEPTITDLSDISKCQSPHTNTPQPSVDQSMQSQSTPLSADRSPASYQCKVLCSVTNGPKVSLSWIRNRHTLKQRNNLDLSVPLCLHLEINIQDNHIYSCVATNPISNHSTQFSIIQFCPQTGLSSVHCCGSIEIVVRLVLSAVVVLATLALLVYHFRSSFQ
ncbi:uncharacterized protein LOC118816826 [Colossoma macropomum]|uniref:uncharacterized protein LOC118816826 n=1 Tax=Colossoma macropomum TaxID=42526 RepID=UPI001865229A|nr:uncharacterized protein LOC118816826 [Colossoma macropomum]